MFAYCVLFGDFGITERAQLAWRCDALWRGLRLTGLPSLPTAQPFIKSMPPLNTTLPCGAGPCYSLLPLLVWGGKHRQTDKLEPPACLLLWSDNSTVSNKKKTTILLLKQEPLHLNFTFFSQLYFLFSTETQSYLWKSLLLAWLVVDGWHSKTVLEALYTSKNRILTVSGPLKKTFAHIISA